MLEENALVESGIGRAGLVAMSVIGAIILGVIAIGAWYNFGHSDAFSENAKIALYLLDRGDDPLRSAATHLGLLQPSNLQP